jgi:hypothetical protein
MAKNRKMRIMIIRSENFFLFMDQAHPFKALNLAFPVPKEKQKGKARQSNPINCELLNKFNGLWMRLGSSSRPSDKDRNCRNRSKMYILRPKL